MIYKECSFLVCFLQNDSSDWLGCIPADSSVINRCFFSELLSSFQCYENLLSSFQYYLILLSIASTYKLYLFEKKKVMRRPGKIYK